MKKFAKLLAMVLAVSMVLTMFVGAFEYKDAAAIDEDKAEAVEIVYNAGIMMGNSKGEFNPKANLTRDEMAKIMFALASTEQKAEDIFALYASLSFADYAAIPAWSKAYVGYAAVTEIMVGNAKGEANALGTLSYVEAAIMLLRSLGLEGMYDDGGEEFVPAFTGSKWYQNAVLTATLVGLYDDLDIADYKAAITREDVAVMIANAIAIADEDDYALAEKVVDVVIGTYEEEEDDEDVEYFETLNGNDFKTEGFDVDAVLFHEIEAVIEDEEVIAGTLKVNPSVYEGTVLVSDLTMEEVEEDDELVGYNLYVGDELVIEKAFDDDFWFGYNEEVLALGEYDEVTVIINENTIFVFGFPVEFYEFAEDEWAPMDTYDSEKKIWKGEYTVEVDGETYDICDEYAELEVEGWYSYQIIDGELVNLKALTVVDAADLDITLNASKNEYAVSYNGAALVNVIGADYKTMWENDVKGEEYTAYLYNDYVLVAYVEVEEEEEEEEVVEPEVIYGFIDGFDAELSIVEDDEDTDEDESGYLWTYTVDVITLAGETKQVVFAEKQAELNYAPAEWLNADFVKLTITVEDEETTVVADDSIVVTYGNVKSISKTTLKAVGGITIALDSEALTFVDCTDSGIELADITVKTESGKTTTIVAEKNVSAYTVMAFSFDGNVVVVYDPACEYGMFGAFLPDAE